MCLCVCSATVIACAWYGLFLVWRQRLLQVCVCVFVCGVHHAQLCFIVLCAPSDKVGCLPNQGDCVLFAVLMQALVPHWGLGLQAPGCTLMWTGLAGTHLLSSRGDVWTTSGGVGHEKARTDAQQTGSYLSLWAVCLWRHSFLTSIKASSVCGLWRFTTPEHRLVMPGWARSLDGFIKHAPA